MFIVVEVNVKAEGDDRPPDGAAVRVEIRDTRRADARAITLGMAEGTVRGHGSWLETLEVAAEDVPDGSTIYVHVDADGDGRVSRGDFVTTRSYPVPDDPEPRVSVSVQRVG